MKKLLTLLFSFALYGIVQAQPQSPPSMIFRVTFANLPASPAAGTWRTITNSDGTGCNGNGAVDYTCEWNGSAWVGAPTPVGVSDANDLSAPVCAIDAVGTDSYAVTLSPAIAAYQTKTLYCFKAGTANTGASSLAINGLAATPIKVVRNSLTTDTATGDILANMWVVVRYDGSNMVMQNPPANPQRAFNAASAATGIWVCDDQVPTNCGYIYWSAANGLQVVCAPALVENDCNYVRKLAAGKLGGFSDRNGTNIFTVTEDNGKGIVKIVLGSDATGDTHYRDSSGNFVRLGIGSTGNVLTVAGGLPSWAAPASSVVIRDFDLVGVDPATGVASHILNKDPLSTACTPLAVVGTNRTTGVCTFPDSDGDYGVGISLQLPGSFTSLDADVWWKTTGAGNARFQFQTLCYADDEADDAAFNTASVVTAAAGTSARPNKVSITGITVTGCAAGELMRVRFFRNRTEASDSLNAALDVEKVVLKIQQ